jgi:S1-C subfamily serine protease
MRSTYRSRSGRWVLGDLIVAVEGQPVRSGGELRLALERRSAGETVIVTVKRDNQSIEIPVRLGEGRR